MNLDGFQIWLYPGLIFHKNHRAIDVHYCLGEYVGSLGRYKIAYIVEIPIAGNGLHHVVGLNRSGFGLETGSRPAACIPLKVIPAGSGGTLRP
jgi:hypothetical protein